MTTAHVHAQKLHHHATLPAYGRPGDAGLDLAALDDTTILPHARVLVPTGIALALPEGTVGLVWDRSGLAAKHGITTMAGVLDHTYRGEIKVVLLNTTDTPYEIKRGDRIAQLLVQPIVTATIEEVPTLAETVRGAGGFGSSGR